MAAQIIIRRGFGRERNGSTNFNIKTSGANFTLMNLLYPTVHIWSCRHSIHFYYCSLLTLYLIAGRQVHQSQTGMIPPPPPRPLGNQNLEQDQISCRQLSRPGIWDCPCAILRTWHLLYTSSQFDMYDSMHSCHTPTLSCAIVFANMVWDLRCPANMSQHPGHASTV
jgi:hypothetical protein